MIFEWRPILLSSIAAAPYNLTVFAKAPTGLCAPDSIAVLGDHVFVGYGDGHLPDGSDGLNSQIVEYKMDGTVVHTYTVPGHNDGLKVDPVTNKLWAIQNEDANANLVIIDTETQFQRLYTFCPAAHGGGYDDLVFRGCKVYVSASNPANNPNTGPAIVSAKLEGNLVAVGPVLAGEASAIESPPTRPLNSTSGIRTGSSRPSGQHRSGQSGRSGINYRQPPRLRCSARVAAAVELSDFRRTHFR